MDDTSGQSLRSRIAAHVISQIVQGVWKEGDRIPSESELTHVFGASRMTVHHALRDLTARGFLVRRSGAGTYVAPPRPYVATYLHRDVIKEIEGRGGVHEAHVIERQITETDGAQAEFFGCADLKPLFHAVIVHLENGEPLELEDRLLDPEELPGCMTVDLRHQTLFSQLMLMRPYRDGSESTRAILPTEQDQVLLRIEANTPCLEVRRRSWRGDTCVTAVRLLRAGKNAVMDGLVKSMTF